MIDDPKIARFGRIPITIGAVLDRWEVSLRDIASLRVGDVLPTTRRVGEDVQLVVSGSAVAQGQVIRTGDRVGVRIVRLGGEPLR